MIAKLTPDTIAKNIPRGPFQQVRVDDDKSGNARFSYTLPKRIQRSIEGSRSSDGRNSTKEKNASRKRSIDKRDMRESELTDESETNLLSYSCSPLPEVQVKRKKLNHSLLPVVQVKRKKLNLSRKKNKGDVKSSSKATTTTTTTVIAGVL